jgi:transcriptional regulator of acetoin/glycerol metabolism
MAADQAAKEAAVNSQMDVFINEKDETGQLKHPYFSELERDMTMLAQTMLSQGMQPTIADLYQRAVYANPETRSKLLAANQAQEQRKAAAERKVQAVAATRAASSVNGSPGTGGSPAERRGVRPLRETIAEAFADLQTR